MAIAITLQQYLDQQGISYDVVPHRHTETSMDAANTAHVPARMVAKSVILEDDSGYLMAVIPANHHVKIGKVNQAVGRKMGLATEAELRDLFSDCELGAIPPIGQAYGVETIVDESLTECPEIYLEAGDHEDFVHLKGSSFRKLMEHAPRAAIS
jgi:Ala-tRNA(Pro) deacylase